MSKEEVVEKKMELKKVKPLKDFVIKHNAYYFELKKGESIEVPEIFIQNLKTEKVIK